VRDVTLVVLCALAVLVAAGVAGAHRTVPAAVDGFTWHRSVDIHEERWVRRSSSWGPPAGSRNHTRETVHVTRPVQDVQWRTEYVFGKAQTRAVYSTRWVHETRTLHTYEIPKRRYSHTVEASGRSRADVAWPAAHGAAGARRASYRVEFTGTDDRRYTARMGERRWLRLDERRVHLLRVTWYGVVLHVRPREP